MSATEGTARRRAPAGMSDGVLFSRLAASCNAFDLPWTRRDSTWALAVRLEEAGVWDQFARKYGVLLDHVAKQVVLDRNAQF